MKTENVLVEEEKLVEHFQDLFGTEIKNPVNEAFDSQVNEEVLNEIRKVKQSKQRVPVDYEVVREVIKGLPLGKSPGPAGVRGELIKYSLGSRVPKIITKLLECLINVRIMPEIMNKGTIVPILKDSKGDRSCVNNIRGITLSDILSIIFELYILNRVERQLKLDKRQFGFRKKASTSHAFWAFEEARRQLAREGKPGYVIFMDFSKAFDKVTRFKLFATMIGKIHELEWLALVQYYAVATVCVLVHLTGKMSRTFKTKVGVKQGGPFSPTGFNMGINLIICIMVLSGLLYVTRGIKSGAIIYADDTTAIVDSAIKMHQLIKIMHQLDKGSP